MVRDYSREWLSRRVIKETTRRNYRNFFENHLIPRPGSKMLHNVMSSDIEEMCHAMCESGLSRRTVYQSNMVPLRSLFRSAVAEKRISESPVALASLPRVKTKRVDGKSLPSGEAVGELASAMRSDWGVSVWLMAGCGLRIGEVLALRDTDLADGAMRLRRQFVRVKRDGVWKAELSPLKAREEGEWRDIPSFVERALRLHLHGHGVARMDIYSMLITAAMFWIRIIGPSSGVRLSKQESQVSHGQRIHCDTSSPAAPSPADCHCLRSLAGWGTPPFRSLMTSTVT